MPNFLDIRLCLGTAGTAGTPLRMPIFLFLRLVAFYGHVFFIFYKRHYFLLMSDCKWWLFLAVLLLS